MKSTKLLCCLMLALQAPLALAETSAKAELGSFGIDLSQRDESVKPGDDFDRYASGKWHDSYQLKDYETRYGAFTTLSDQAEIQVRAIIEEMAKSNAPAGSNEQKIRDLYNSYMDVAARNAAGIEPIRPLLKQIESIDSRLALTQAFGRSGVDGTISPLGGGVGLDRKNPDRYLLNVGVSGLGLPDKDYYFNQAERFVQIRAAYLKHIERMLGFVGVSKPGERAKAILALETRLASQMWDRAQMRDREKTYNLMSFADFERQYGGYDWAAHFRADGMEPPAEVNVFTPSAVNPVIEIVSDTPLATWIDYLRFHAIDNHASLLSEEIDNASFDFNGRMLSGQKAQRELWKRGVALVGGSRGSQGLGDAVGQIYVSRHFKPEAKQAMDELVENLRRALRQNIEQLDWMGEATKEEAYKKLASFRPKIGYPSQWRDYSQLTIVPGDLLANVRALRAFYNDDQNARLGRASDKDEWFMTPQTVNAYYNSSFNEIVFPAAILQPPFFDVNADPAVNYGAIGAVIGHEMGHGFDDQGSKSDHAGIQRNWWDEQDRKRFEQRTSALGAQYDSNCPLEGHCVNGQLTMGENIGDLGGVSMAYTAYKLSLNGQEAPVLEGLTGDQRFFLSWAQVWKAKYRDEALVNQLQADPHSPPRYRINGPLRNLNEWYQAFDVQPDDALYLKPEERVRIW
ncbi:MAG: M13 family metallopeptidase [Rhodanobacteraceae bacterium]|nr:M13 family metallopeptidase [Rhodanobacteraceae bacterium]